MADEKKTPRLSIVKDVVGIVIPIVGVATIILSYYDYFYNILKQPSLTVNCSISRVTSTPQYHVIKMTFETENTTNTKVEVLSNRVEVYGMPGFTGHQPDSLFISTVQHNMKNVDSFPIWEANQNYLSWGESVSYLQLYPNHYWLLPKEKQKFELVTVIPQYSPNSGLPYHRVRLAASFIIGTKAQKIQVIDSITKDGVIWSRLFLNEGKKLRELSFDNHDDSLFLDKHCVAHTLAYADAWLLDEQSKTELPTLAQYLAFIAGFQHGVQENQGTSGNAPANEQPPQKPAPPVSNEGKISVVKAYNLSGTWINHSNKSEWKLQQTGNTLSFEVFKSSGKKKGQGSGTVGNGYVSITYNDFTFDIYKGVLNISSDGKMLEGTLTSSSGLDLPYVLDRK